MKTLTPQVANEIKDELENLPEKYANTEFNSTHEALAVIQEEFEELKQQVFFGEKAAPLEPVTQADMKRMRMYDSGINESNCFERPDIIHKSRMRHEAIQIAAMCVRFIQELT